MASVTRRLRVNLASKCSKRWDGLGKFKSSRESGLGAEGSGIKECIQIGRREELEGVKVSNSSLGIAQRRLLMITGGRTAIHRLLETSQRTLSL